MNKTDQKLWQKYQAQSPWGLSTSVDLTKCDPKFIRSHEKIKEFVDQLCQLIEMKQFGKTQIVDFGEDLRVSGFSMTQLIETSLISAHFANQTNAAYIDIFSCKFYAPTEAAHFSKNFFKAESMSVKTTLRF